MSPQTSVEMRSHCKRLLSILRLSLGAFLTTAFPALAHAATPFVHETVDAAGNVGSFSSLALDAQGNPRISYSDQTNGDLKYAAKSGATWTIETVDASGSVGSHTSIALDAQGNPRISYYDSGSGNLKYAAKSGATWTIETVDASPSVGQSTSLALDAQGNPRISYYRFAPSDGDLKYAAKNFGTWTIETVDASGDAGVYTSLALDAQARPHIGYTVYDAGGSHLRYATKNGPTWTLETVGAPGLGSYASLALDASGNPRISCYNASTIAYAAKGGATWTIETVDAPGDVGYFTSLALDAQGNPRISYLDIANSDLKYAAKNGATWTIETVDATGNVGNYASLALDAQGNPHISHYDATNLDLKYTDSAVHLLSPVGGERWAAGSQQTVRWGGAGTVSILLSDDGGSTYTTQLSAVGSNAVTFTVPALTTEQARVRVSRSSPFSTSDSPGYFSIAPDLASPWWARTVDAAGTTGQFTSLALDAQGSARIGYYDVTNGDLKYASKSGGSWTLETVDASGNVGTYASLALDAQGNPRISYYDGSPNFNLKYASKTGGVWTIETVDAGGDVGSYCSLALDAQGNPRISYYDLTNGDLKYASKSGGIWTLEIADAPVATSVGQYTSLALDAQGNPRIGYYDVTNGNLKYASKSGGAWVAENVDISPTTVGLYTSLALDTQGNPCISYYDNTNGDLDYASKSGSVWTLEKVDAVGNVGAYNSLALDALGNPGISYFDLTNGDLKYAVKSGGLWAIEVADAAGDVGRFTSLVLDAQGNPRVSYYDAGANLDLKYASAALEISSPTSGDVWPVGASRTVTWDGTGRADLSLSVDGGATWNTIASGLTGGEYRDLVPHSPSRFAQYKLERAVPHSVGETGLFTIQTSVLLLTFAAQASPQGGAELSWSTDPGPDDLAGYRVERAGTSGGWTTLVTLKETHYRDVAGGAGDLYRLSAVNGLGEELVLGEASLLPVRPLAAWPLPHRGGDLSVSFAVFGRLGSASGQAEVALYDISGRRVRLLARGSFTGAQQSVKWDGRDQNGNEVRPGVYLLRAESGGEHHELKIAVVK